MSVNMFDRLLRNVIPGLESKQEEYKNGMAKMSSDEITDDPDEVKKLEDKYRDVLDNTANDTSHEEVTDDSDAVADVTEHTRSNLDEDNKNISSRVSNESFICRKQDMYLSIMLKILSSIRRHYVCGRVSLKQHAEYVLHVRTIGSLFESYMEHDIRHVPTYMSQEELILYIKQLEHQFKSKYKHIGKDKDTVDIRVIDGSTLVISGDSLKSSFNTEEQDSLLLIDIKDKGRHESLPEYLLRLVEHTDRHASNGLQVGWSQYQDEELNIAIDGTMVQWSELLRKTISCLSRLSLRLSDDFDHHTTKLYELVMNICICILEDRK